MGLTASQYTSLEYYIDDRRGQRAFALHHLGIHGRRGRKTVFEKETIYVDFGGA